MTGDRGWNPLLEKYRESHDSGRWEFMARHDASVEYSWSVPSDEALAAIESRGPVVELGAGTGYWAAVLKAHGVDIIAYDLRPVETGTNKSHPGVKASHTEVLQGDETVLVNYPERTLLLCWPNRGVGAPALRHYRGNTVIYVGQPNGGDGGFTGDGEFHGLLGTDWNLVATIELPRWIERNDKMYIYERKVKGNK